MSKVDDVLRDLSLLTVAEFCEVANQINLPPSLYSDVLQGIASYCGVKRDSKVYVRIVADTLLNGARGYDKIKAIKGIREVFVQDIGKPFVPGLKEAKDFVDGREGLDISKLSPSGKAGFWNILNCNGFHRVTP